MKITTIKCSCCSDTEYRLTVPYEIVMPSMEADEDGYVLHMNADELCDLAEAIGSVMQDEIAERIGDS